MSLIRWNPFREIDHLLDDRPFNRLLDPDTLSVHHWTPRVDITETDKEYLIKAELPEVKKDDVHVSVSHGVLTLSGERRYENQDEKKHHIERFYGSFSRSFTLPESVVANDIHAEFEDGMLKLHLAKTEQPEASSVDIDIH